MCFVVNTLSQYLVEPRHVHLVDEKHMTRYMKGMVDYGLIYTRDHDFKLHGYIDSDWVGSVSNRKSTSGGCQSRVNHDLMAKKEEVQCFSQHYKSEIYYNLFCQL